MATLISPTALWPELLLALSVTAPLGGLGLLAIHPRLTVTLLPLFALPALLAALMAPLGSTLGWPRFLTGARLLLDRTGRVFLLTAAILWLVVGGFIAGYLRSDTGRAQFAGFHLITMLGNFGLILTPDPAPFLAFFCLDGPFLLRNDPACRHPLGTASG